MPKIHTHTHKANIKNIYIHIRMCVIIFCITSPFLSTIYNHYLVLGIVIYVNINKCTLFSLSVFKILSR